MSCDRIYYLSHQAKELSENARLFPVEWNVLLAISEGGLLNGHELCQKLHLSPEGCSQILEKLVRLNLLAEPELTLAEYITYRQIGKTTPANPASTPGQPVRFSLTRKKTPVPDSPGKTQPRNNAGTSFPESLELQPLLDFIRSHAADGSLGQLAIYRLFIKIPKPLLEMSGLSVIQLDNTPAVTNNPDLIRALLQAAREITGKDYAPSSPYVPAN